MPYEKVGDLPEGVRNHLPAHAQEIYMKAFNNAWEQYRDPKKRRLGGTQEEAAHRVAWSAVEKEYMKDDSGKWVRI